MEVFYGDSDGDGFGRIRILSRHVSFDHYVLVGGDCDDSMIPFIPLP